MFYIINTVCRLGDGKEYLFQAKDEVRCIKQNYYPKIRFE